MKELYSSIGATVQNLHSKITTIDSEKIKEFIMISKESLVKHKYLVIPWALIGLVSVFRLRKKKPANNPDSDPGKEGHALSSSQIKNLPPSHGETISEENKFHNDQQKLSITNDGAYPEEEKKSRRRKKKDKKAFLKDYFSQERKCERLLQRSLPQKAQKGSNGSNDEFNDSQFDYSTTISENNKKQDLLQKLIVLDSGYNSDSESALHEFEQGDPEINEEPPRTEARLPPSQRNDDVFIQIMENMLNSKSNSA